MNPNSQQSLQAWFGLKDTTCIVAGANGRLGQSCVKALQDCGAEVIGLDVGVNADSGLHEVDMTQEAALTKFFAGLSKSSANNWAFINCSYPRTSNWGKLGFENVSLEDWNQNVSMHLGSAFAFTQASVKFLLERKEGGTILNFSSIYGVLGPDLRIYDGTPMQNPSPYAGIKAGIIGLSRYVAAVYGAKNIRCNVVAPGGIEAGQPASFVDAYESRTPMKRMGTSEDVAGTVAFLCGPSANYITGQVLMVDGGWTAW